MTKDTIIKLSSINVLNFITHSMIEYGFLLAHEQELSDLKGLIPASSFAEVYTEGHASWELELDILELIDDPAVVILATAMERIREHVVTYALINSLELEDTMHPKVRKLSDQTWYKVMNYTPTYQNYSEILEALSEKFHCYGLLIWNLAYQQVFCLNDVFKHSRLKYTLWDGDIEILGLNNRNAVFLLEICKELFLDSKKIERHKLNRNGKI